MAEMGKTPSPHQNIVLKVTYTTAKNIHNTSEYIQNNILSDTAIGKTTTTYQIILYFHVNYLILIG
jgi:hypothetical protein